MGHRSRRPDRFAESGRPTHSNARASLERERSDMIDRFKKAIKSSIEVVDGSMSAAMLTSSCISLRAASKSMNNSPSFFYENTNIKAVKGW